MTTSNCKKAFLYAVPFWRVSQWEVSGVSCSLIVSVTIKQLTTVVNNCSLFQMLNFICEILLGTVETISKSLQSREDLVKVKTLQRVYYKAGN